MPESEHQLFELLVLQLAVKLLLVRKASYLCKLIHLLVHRGMNWCRVWFQALLIHSKVVLSKQAEAIWASSRENLSLGFPKSEFQTSLISYRDQLEN